jgi:hypothetical protein
MAARPSPSTQLCFADAPLAAQDVARGVTRLFFNQDIFALCEVPLPNGRRADMMALDYARQDTRGAPLVKVLETTQPLKRRIAGPKL